MKLILKIMILGMTLSLGLCIFNANAANIGQAYRDAEKLSNPEKNRNVSEALQLMKSIRQFSLERLQDAHDQRKVVQINCVRRSFATVKGLLRISEEANVNLKEAMITGRADLINHEYVKIIMAKDRLQVLRTKIEECASTEMNDPLTTSQQRKLTFKVDESIQAFTPSSDEQTVIIYEPIASERPEAISSSQ